MAGGGVADTGSSFGKPPKKKPDTLFGDPSTFAAATKQQAGDYDSIMNQYKDFAKNALSNSIMPTSVSSSNPITSSSISPNNPLTSNPITSSALQSPRNVNFDPVTAKTSDYSQSQDVTNSLGTLKELSDTGGYSAQNIQDIRARNLSPINSIYSSGKQNLERQRSLSGGYSPNFNAVSASMARDQANKISDITTRTNADIAQNVASNRLAAATPYASASANANSARTEADQRNADIINEINKYNSGSKLDTDKFNVNTGLGLDKYNRDTQLAVDQSNRDIRLNTDKSNRDFNYGVSSANRDAQLGVDKFNSDNLFRTNQANQANQANNQGNILDSIRGQASLYGTTPALANTFGNQVNQAANLGQNQQALNLNKKKAIYGMAGG